MGILIIILLIFSPLLHTRPISYPNGWTVIQENNWDDSNILIHYSPNIKNSYGIKLLNKNDYEEEKIIFQWNKLLYRKNTKSTQGNIYFQQHYGISIREPKNNFHSSLALFGDWESRKYFSSYMLRVEYEDNEEKASFHQKARLGLAPYLAEYGESIHTFLIAEFQHHPEEKQKSKQFISAFIIRLFKGNFLTELGIDDNKDLIFNFIKRF